MDGVLQDIGFEAMKENKREIKENEICTKTYVMGNRVYMRKISPLTVNMSEQEL